MTQISHRTVKAQTENPWGGDSKPATWAPPAPRPPRWSATPSPGAAVRGDNPPQDREEGGTDFQQSSVEVCPSPAAGREATSTQHPCGVYEEGPSPLRSPRPVICVTRNTADASQ